MVGTRARTVEKGNLVSGMPYLRKLSSQVPARAELTPEREWVLLNFASWVWLVWPTLPLVRQW